MDVLSGGTATGAGVYSVAVAFETIPELQSAYVLLGAAFVGIGGYFLLTAKRRAKERESLEIALLKRGVIPFSVKKSAFRVAKGIFSAGFVSSGALYLALSQRQQHNSEGSENHYLVF